MWVSCVRRIAYPGEPQFEKDIAALRSHVIDGIEDVKNLAEGIDHLVARIARLLNLIVIDVCVVTMLIAAHILRHW